MPTLNFDTERWDTDNIHDTATDRLTAQTAGKYYIFAHIVWELDTSTPRLSILLTDTNGTKVIAAEDRATIKADASMSVSTHCELNVGDYVEVQVDHSSGMPIIDILSVDATSPEFGMVKLP